jgi:hypothetical protein
VGWGDVFSHGHNLTDLLIYTLPPLDRAKHKKLEEVDLLRNIKYTSPLKETALYVIRQFISRGKDDTLYVHNA